MRATARGSTQSTPGWPGWGSYASSVLVHGLLIALLAFGWWRYTPPPAPAQILAIEATVVTDLPAAPAPSPAPAPEPAPAPDDTAAREAAAAEAAEQAREREQAEQRAREAEQRQAEEAARVAEAQRKVEAQKEAQKAVDAKRKADAANAEAQAKAAAERKAEADRLAKQKAEDDKRRQADAQAREQADLRARMAAEERLNAARSGPQALQYAALIRAAVERNWNRPPSARAGLDCEVHVTQVPGGTVTAVQVTRCNGDAAVRESIENAVRRASPLPMPENADLFERNLVFNFKPND